MSSRMASSGMYPSTGRCSIKYLAPNAREFSSPSVPQSSASTKSMSTPFPLSPSQSGGRSQESHPPTPPLSLAPSTGFFLLAGSAPVCPRTAVPMGKEQYALFGRRVVARKNIKRVKRASPNAFRVARCSVTSAPCRRSSLTSHSPHRR